MKHRGAGVPSIAGGAPSIWSPENPAMRACIVCGGPWSEWWAGFGTVTAAFEGFIWGAFVGKEEGGKCLFL